MPHAHAGGAQPLRIDPRWTAPRDDAHGFRVPLPGDGWSPLWSSLARVGGVLPPTGRADADPWALLRGRGDSSGRGRPDGSIVGTLGSRVPYRGPRFDTIVPPAGYAWWYVDAISADHRFGLTIIGFIGSVFSPYYKASGRGDPANHVSINVALYGPRGSRWCMTERPRDRLWRSEDTLQVGPSMMRWEGDALVIDIVETATPIPSKVRGTVRLYPETIGDTAFVLSDGGQHLWHPVAPRARVEVDMAAPDLNWSGSGYFDSNFGNEPLEAGFRDWQWSRAHLKDDVAVTYEGVRRDGSDFAMALKFDRNGQWHDAPLPPSSSLPRTGFGMTRKTRGQDPKLIRTWENAPFYARSALSTELYGERVNAVHESLSMDRFVSPIVQFMLPFRMPRILG
jgi:carotenoid 1,2-hydratase